jgi:hypothetical protein
MCLKAELQVEVSQSFQNILATCRLANIGGKYKNMRMKHTARIWPSGHRYDASGYELYC